VVVLGVYVRDTDFGAQTMDATANIVPAGSLIYIGFDSATLTALAGFCGMIRYRSQRK
jgi:exoribonuclease II